MTQDKREHWESVYETKDAAQVSWFRPHLDVSLALFKRAGLNASSRVVDVGGGASTLVDDLLALGVRQIAVLDISSASLEVAKRRLGSRGSEVQWLVGDASKYPFPPASVDFWHDRAVLHFLTDANDARGYIANATRTIAQGGYAIIGGFASDGPEKCSGLTVARRDPEEIAALFGSDFELIERRRETHATPSGAHQSFAYALLHKIPRPRQM